MPLALKANYKIGGTEFHSTLGPYVEAAISGRRIYRTTGLDGKFEETGSAKFGKSDSEIKRFGYGFTAGTGIDINSLSFRISFDYGLANLSNLADEGFHTNNRTLSISIGYKFNS